MGPVNGNTERSVGSQDDTPKGRIAMGVLTLVKNIYGRGPKRAKVYLLDNAVLVVLPGGFTRAEELLWELGQGQSVKDQRALVQEAMRSCFSEVIESETGRKVKSLMSSIDQGADVSSVVFLLEPRSEDDQEAAASASE